MNLPCFFYPLDPCMVYYIIYLHLPEKSTIHVGKYTIVPWIRNGIGTGGMISKMFHLRFIMQSESLVSPRFMADISSTHFGNGNVIIGPGRSSNVAQQSTQRVNAKAVCTSSFFEHRTGELKNSNDLMELDDISMMLSQYSCVLYI